MSLSGHRSLPDLVSVVIPARDVVDTIDDQLAALAAQDCDFDLEVIVADNGSSDGLDRHLADHPLADRLSLRRVDASARAGIPFARNTGAAASSGEFVAFCDADDRVHPTWLAALVAAARDHAAVGGAVETTTLNTPRVQAWRPMLPADVPYRLPGFWPFAIGCTIGVWRDVFDRVGGFDLDYSTGGEDVDFAYRIHLAGGTVGHAADALVAYRLRDGLRSTWRQALAYGRADARIFADYRRHGMPRPPWYQTADLVAYLLIRNPLLPTALTRVPTGLWTFRAGNLVGRIHGSLRHRCLYI